MVFVVNSWGIGRKERTRYKRRLESKRSSERSVTVVRLKGGKSREGITSKK